MEKGRRHASPLSRLTEHGSLPRPRPSQRSLLRQEPPIRPAPAVEDRGAAVEAPVILGEDHEEVGRQVVAPVQVPVVHVLISAQEVPEVGHHEVAREPLPAAGRGERVNPELAGAGARADHDRAPAVHRHR